MYPVIVIVLMLVLPLVSIGIEARAGVSIDAALVGKWFVFWGVGVRLLLAGLRQMLQPKYTAQTILGLEHDESLVLVRELGFANTALGAIGVGSIVAGGWMRPAALAGAIFYLLAGLGHVRKASRNRHENIALISDLLFGALLAVVFVLSR